MKVTIEVYLDELSDRQHEALLVLMRTPDSQRGQPAERDDLIPGSDDLDDPVSEVRAGGTSSDDEGADERVRADWLDPADGRPGEGWVQVTDPAQLREAFASGMELVMNCPSNGINGTGYIEARRHAESADEAIEWFKDGWHFRVRQQPTRAA